jgi:branched-chain amino acid transport system permease protein
VTVTEPPPTLSAVPEAAPRARLGAAGVAAGLVAAVLLGLAPFALDPASLNTLGRIVYFALLAASLDLLVGITGLPSLAHAAYFAVGAYAAGLVAKDITPLVIVAVPAAVVAAGVAAAITGWLAVRSRGIFFLMLTLAVGEIVFLLAESARDVTGGSNGLYGIPVLELVPGSDALSQAALRYWFVLALFWVGFGVLWAVSRSPFGLALRGIRGNEERMRALGYSPHRYKFVAFCVAGAIAGLAGALLASHQQLVTPADAAFGTAVVALVSVIIGGAGTLWGPCLGAAVVVLVRDQIGPSLGGHGPLLLGLVFVAAVYLLPGGIAGAIARVRGGRR